MRAETRQVLLEAIIKRWGLTSTQGERLRSFKDNDEALAKLLTINGLLNQLFRDIDVEKEWVHEPRQIFEDQSALAWILSGADGLKKVEQTVRYISGQ